MPTHETHPEWQRLLSIPRQTNVVLSRAEIPDEPGVYAWFKDEDCVYVGKASNLRERLTAHRRTSLDLSRSTLRASVAVQELGITRACQRRSTRMTTEQIQAVDAWVQGADLAWVTCRTVREAETLEKRLRAEWLPPLNLA